MKSIFEFKNYQSYLLYYFQLQRGNQARLAEFLGCRSSFLTQVIDQKVELSLDCATKIPNFLDLSKNEKLAFLLFVQKEKVIDFSEKEFFENHIIELRKKNNLVNSRLNDLDELSDEFKAKYYSSWVYAAVHILCAFSWANNLDQISKELKVDKKVISEAIQFLLESKLILEKNKQFIIRKRQIHLGADSEYIFNHHINWRLKAVEKLNSKTQQLFNFSSLIGISVGDAPKVKEILLTAISEINQVVKKSGEESAYFINIDFMNL